VPEVPEVPGVPEVPEWVLEQVPARERRSSAAAS